MSEETREAYRTKMKELAREQRRVAYQKAKAKIKAERLALKSSPQGEEQRAKLKERRREAYLKAKAAFKERQAARDAADEKARAAAAAAALAEKTAALLSSMTTGDQLKPKLRLVERGGDDGKSRG